MKNNKTLSKLNSYIAGNRKYLILVIISALLANIFMLVAPYISGRAIDFIKGENNVDFPMVAKIIGILFAVYVLNALFTWGMTVFTNALSNHSIKKMRKDAFGKISKLPLKFFDGHSHGDIISRLTNDIDAVSEGLLQGITQLFSGIVTVVGSLVLMFLLDWRITLCVIVITIICIFVSKAIATNSGKMFRLQAQTIGELNGYVSETVGNLKVVKAFGYEDKSSEVFGEINSRLYDCGQKAQFYSSLVNPTTRYINNLAYISVGVLGGLAALAGHLSVGIISSFLIYATQFARPINDMTSILTQLQSAQAAAARIFALGEIEPETPDEDRPELEVKNGEVTFKDVDFSYNKDKELIKDLNIVAKPGQRVAIVGPTGAGKTTIVNLLMNFYGVDKGTIFVDGQAIDSVQRDSLRKNFGMVLQDTWLFAGTVKENIAYGKEGATDEEIINAAKAASAHGFIKRLPNGYDTMITEDGGNLSSGQKQLLTIARAMLSDPKILILDEPTAVLTPQETEKLFNILRKMKAQGCAIIIITHKLGEVMDISDRVTILRKGKSVETVNTAESSEKQLTELMVGKAVELSIERPEPVNVKPILNVVDLTVKNSEGSIALDDVSFVINRGEILGVAGIAGSGQKELCETIAGLQKIEKGAVLYNKENIIGKTPKEIINLGISMSFIPEDRLGMGLIASVGMTDNMLLKTYKQGKLCFVDRKPAKALSKELIEKLEIKTPSTELPVRMLSGGNVQKVLLGREIHSEPDLLITAYPVRGLDINSSYLIYSLLNEQKKKNTAVLFIGEDLDVLLELCDRIMVLCHGKITGICDAKKVTKEQVGMMMTGSTMEEVLGIG